MLVFGWCLCLSLEHGCTCKFVWFLAWNHDCELSANVRAMTTNYQCCAWVSRCEDERSRPLHFHGHVEYKPDLVACVGDNGGCSAGRGRHHTEGSAHTRGAGPSRIRRRLDGRRSHGRSAERRRHGRRGEWTASAGHHTIQHGTAQQGTA